MPLTEGTKRALDYAFHFVNELAGMHTYERIRERLRRGQGGDVGRPPDSPRHRNLPDQVLALEEHKRRERLQWLGGLPDNIKLQLESFSENFLKMLLDEDDPAQRERILRGLLDKPFWEDIQSGVRRFGDALGKALDSIDSYLEPETRKMLQRYTAGVDRLAAVRARRLARRPSEVLCGFRVLLAAGGGLLLYIIILIILAALG